MIDCDNGSSMEISSPCYELSDNAIKELTEKLLNKRTSEIPEGHQIITVEVDGKSEYANIGRHIERLVFEEAFGNDSKIMNEEYGPYESASTFFISIDNKLGNPIGVLRSIENSPAGLKTLNDATNTPFNVSVEDAISEHEILTLDKVWDIGTVAILPEYRGNAGPSGVQLYRAMYVSALKQGIEHLVSIVDERPLRLLTQHFGLPFVPLANSQPGPYMGSEKSYAVYAHVPDFYKVITDRIAKTKSTFGKNLLSSLINGNDDDSIILGR